jgi:hypothetical protein
MCSSSQDRALGIAIACGRMCLWRIHHSQQIQHMLLTPGVIKEAWHGRNSTDALLPTWW